jgi:hypothetical protein
MVKQPLPLSRISGEGDGVQTVCALLGRWLGTLFLVGLLGGAERLVLVVGHGLGVATLVGEGSCLIGDVGSMDLVVGVRLVVGGIERRRVGFGVGLGSLFSSSCVLTVVVIDGSMAIGMVLVGENSTKSSSRSLLTSPTSETD